VGGRARARERERERERQASAPYIKKEKAELPKFCKLRKPVK
jgi:hypothetical protein